jgi:asparagine synthase (glutamine-hydrolysing)
VSENIERATENVHSSLQYSVEKNLEGKNRVGVAFSGGLDSAILTKLIEETGVKTSLLTVYAEHSHDSSYAKEVANLFGLEHIAIEVDESVKGRLAMFKELLSTENLMDLSIALILNLVAEKAASCGIEDVVVGQGADELFGGYQKYLNILTSRGEMSVEQVLKKDFDALMSYGVSRDETSIAMFANPLMPFINKKVAESAFSLPTKYKIDSDSSTRKVVLRQLAKKLGLSEKVYSHSKKAMQYSSGVQRLLLRIAKKRNT